MKQQLKEKNSGQNEHQANPTQTETRSTNRNQDVDSVAGLPTDQIYASGQTLGKRTYHQSLTGQQSA
jgi:hypothetical protein